jgi:large subunit ribosomal protein L25
MSTRYQLAAEPRTVTGKQVSQLRNGGQTPIVVYGRKSDPIALQTPTKELIRILGLAGGTQLIEIRVAGEKGGRMTLAKDVQRHVTKHIPLHVDFLQVVMDEQMVSEVPVHVVGEPPAAKAAGVMLATELNTITVRALPGHLPPAIEIDASGLMEVGDALTVGDIPVSGEYEILTDPELVIARVSQMAQAREEEVEGEAAEELEEARIPEESGAEPGEG